MKIEFQMEDGTDIKIEDKSDGIDIEFARWEHDEMIRFYVHFRTDQDMREFLTAFELFKKGFNL